jgi:hypothetical protein
MSHNPETNSKKAPKAVVSNIKHEDATKPEKQSEDLGNGTIKETF